MALQIVLDWAKPEPAPVGDSDGVSVGLFKQEDSCGWPMIEVVADDGPTLWAWLRDTYGLSEDEASELASQAESV